MAKSTIPPLIAQQRVAESSGQPSTSFVQAWELLRGRLNNIKTARFALIDVPSATQGAYQDTDFLWDTPYKDANYVVQVSLEGSGAVSFSNKTATGFTIRLINVRASASFGTAHILAVHD